MAWLEAVVVADRPAVTGNDNAPQLSGFHWTVQSGEATERAFEIYSIQPMVRYTRTVNVYRGTGRFSPRSEGTASERKALDPSKGRSSIFALFLFRSSL